MSQEKYRIQSLKQRLKNLSEDKKISFDYILLIYMNEGLLHRLEISRFNRNFILKGGFLLSSILSNLGRTTRDLDFLGKGIRNDVAGMIDAFTEICQISYDDLLTFQIEKLEAIIIKIQQFLKSKVDKLKVKELLMETVERLKSKLDLKRILWHFKMSVGKYFIWRPEQEQRQYTEGLYETNHNSSTFTF